MNHINLSQASFVGISGKFEVESYSEFAAIMYGMFPNLAAVVVADITVDVVVEFFTAQSEALHAIFPYHKHADLKTIIAGMPSVEGVTVIFTFLWVIDCDSPGYQPDIMLFTLSKTSQLFLLQSLLKLKISVMVKHMLPMISSPLSNASVKTLSHYLTIL